MTATRPSRWVVAYDCPCDKRRRRIAVLLEGYGVRVQESVFECELPSEVVLRLQSRLQRLINADEDAIRLWPLSRSCCARIVNLGRPVASPGIRDVVL
jgi:CRISPR-associated protein Cas2